VLVVSLAFCVVCSDGEGGHWVVEGAHRVKPACNCQVSGGSLQNRVTTQLQENPVSPPAQHDETGQGIQGQELLQAIRGIEEADDDKEEGGPQQVYAIDQGRQQQQGDRTAQTHQSSQTQISEPSEEDDKDYNNRWSSSAEISKAGESSKGTEIREQEKQANETWYEPAQAISYSDQEGRREEVYPSCTRCWCCSNNNKTCTGRISDIKES